ncbi:MAG: ABC transporter substrate-binding protein [Deltaproteobacteria bacterium]|nr:ABC transporter substrate-binding protein [Deltaproteobacteria bacterium]
MAGSSLLTSSPSLTSRAVSHALAGVAVVGALAAVVGSCTRGPSSSEEGPIRIGVVMPQTGSLGPDGQLWLKGIQLATQEINAAGGPLPGRLVELVVLDSETDTSVAVSQAQRAVEAEGVVAIIGDAGSGGTLAIYEGVTRDANVPQVSCCATSPSLTVASTASPLEQRFFFRTAPSDALQGQVVARIADAETCTRMAILHIDDAYGAPFAAAIQSEFTRLGGTVVATVPFVDERPSYTTEVTRVAMANPGCVALIAYPETAGTILRDYARLTMAPSVLWIGTDGLRSDTFVDEVGSTLLATIDFQGAAPITQPAGPTYQSFVERHRAAWGTEPGPFVSNNYDAAALLYLAIARAESTEGGPIMESVRALGDPGGEIVRVGELSEAVQRLQAGEQVNYEGASGSVDVSDLGDVRTDYEVWRVTDDGMGIQQERIIQATDLE